MIKCSRCKKEKKSTEFYDRNKRCIPCHKDLDKAKREGRMSAMDKIVNSMLSRKWVLA